MIGLFVSIALGLAKHFLPTAIGGALADVVKPLVGSLSDSKRASADVAIAEVEQRREQIMAHRAVLLAEQKHPETRWIRPGFAALFFFYIGAVVLDSLNVGWPPEVWEVSRLPLEIELVMFAVIGAYYTIRPFEKYFKK